MTWEQFIDVLPVLTLLAGCRPRISGRVGARWRRQSKRDDRLRFIDRKAEAYAALLTSVHAVGSSLKSSLIPRTSSGGEA
jgi:hypothetical protein